MSPGDWSIALSFGVWFGFLLVEAVT